MPKPHRKSGQAKNEVSALLSAAVGAHRNGRLDDAVLLYRRVLAVSNDNFDARHLLGAALCQKGDLSAGIELIERALALKPRSARALLNLGNAQLALKRSEEALKSFRRLAAINPDDVQALRGQGRALVALFRPAEAMPLLSKALRLRPQDHEIMNDIGTCHAVAREFIEARKAFSSALRLRPDYRGALINLANVLGELHLYRQSAQLYHRLLEGNPNDIVLLTNLARVLRRLWQADKALEPATRALEVAPNGPNVKLVMGNVLMDLGRNDEAQGYFKEAIASDPGSVPEALASYAQIHKFAGDEPEIEMIAAQLARSNLPPPDREMLGYAQAKCFDDMKQYGRAFEALVRAKEVYPLMFAIDSYRRFVDANVATFTREFFAERERFGIDSEIPVFVIGMPRSGTSLTEQIIASHPQAFGVGELNDVANLARRLGFDVRAPEKTIAGALSLTAATSRELAQEYLRALREAAPHATRIVNKMPHNFELVWLITLLFPRARIVHCVRDPMDTCLSVFMQHFSGSHGYSRDLGNLGSYYREYQRLTRHWHAVLGRPMLDHSYEELTLDPEGQARRLISFIGLPWDERCLRFHETERAVLTFSRWQVRQPIYRTSVKRWKNYEPWLGPLAEALRE